MSTTYALVILKTIVKIVVIVSYYDHASLKALGSCAFCMSSDKPLTVFNKCLRCIQRITIRHDLKLVEPATRKDKASVQIYIQINRRERDSEISKHHRQKPFKIKES